MKGDTKIVSSGRAKRHTGTAVNPALVRASTVLFDTWEDKQYSDKHRHHDVDNYGRHGTSTTFAFRELMCDLERGEGSYIYPCGTAAITSSLLSFLQAGDHLLVVDSVYEPTRNFCDGTLARMGVETQYYDPLIGADIRDLIRDNTAVIFLESPGSLSMEVQDVPAIVEVARAKGVVTMIDNTFASPFNFRPLEHGVDIAIHSATKYLNGHSDVMLGVATANKKHWMQLRRRSYELGQCASVDDIYATMRGIRTLGVRMRQHQQSALKLAQWLQQHPLVDHVRHPALDTCPGWQSFADDFDGASGLFSMVMKQGGAKQVANMVDSMTHFKMGYSWGGFESLILPVLDVKNKRTATEWSYQAPLIRLSIGLEDVQDLKADLESGLQRYAEAG